MSEVTRTLSEIEQGDPRVSEMLLPLVYDELRKLVAAKLAQERPGQTLQATALVHDAYMRPEDAGLSRILRETRRKNANSPGISMGQLQRLLGIVPPRQRSAGCVGAPRQENRVWPTI